MRTLLKTCAMLGIIMSIPACATRTTIVVDKNSDIVRLDQDVRCKVSTYQGNGVWASSGSMVLPKGWLAGPGPRQ